MSAESVPVTIQVLDKEYMISCPPEEKEALLESARELNNRMRQVREAGKVLGTERMAVMAALNVIHEFSSERSARNQLLAAIGTNVRRLEEKVRSAIPRRHAIEPVE